MKSRIWCTHSADILLKNTAWLMLVCAICAAPTVSNKQSINLFDTSCTENGWCHYPCQQTISSPFHTAAIMKNLLLTLERFVYLTENILSKNMLLAKTNTHALLAYALVPGSCLILFIIYNTSATEALCKLPCSKVAWWCLLKEGRRMFHLLEREDHESASVMLSLSSSWGQLNYLRAYLLSAV